MEFKQVIQVCLDFSIANGFTIQSYPPNSPDKLQVHSRTTRLEILVEREPDTVGHWRLKLLQDATGDKTSMTAIVSTAGQLHAQLICLWEGGTTENDTQSFN